MLAASPAAALTLNLGGGDGLLGLGGSGSATNATVNSGAVGSGSGGSNAVVNTDLLGGNGGSTANVDLGGSGGTGRVLGLFGSGDDPATANVDLGGGTNGNVLLDLFGPAGGVDNPNARVTLGNGGTGVAGLGLLGGNDGANADVLLDLFGPGGSGGAGGTGSGGAGGSGASGNGGSGIGIGSGGGAGGSNGLRLQTASLDKTTGACFTPDAAQAAKLAARHDYNATTFASWQGVASLKIVDIGVCPAAAPGLAARPNIGRLQAYIDANAALKAGLAQAGRSARDVVAVDKSGRTLVVYVM